MEKAESDGSEDGTESSVSSFLLQLVDRKGATLTARFQTYVDLRPMKEPAK
jgi:hypothetical protein